LIVDALDKLSASKLKGLSEADWKFPELDFSSLISESNVKG